MKVVGQGETYARLLRRARALQVHHGLVIEGSRGMGKSTALREIAQALLCQSSDDRAPCRSCRICRLVASDSHPDVHRLTVLEGKQDVAVEQVRELQSALGRTAVEGRARIVLIDPADRLNEQGQNALLKTLEEPGERTFLLLATTRPEHLLETVRSRTDRLRLTPLPDAEVLRVLTEHEAGTPEERTRAVALARGSSGLALELIRTGALARSPRLVAFVDAGNDISPIELARALLEGAGDRAESERRTRLMLHCAAETVRQRVSTALASDAATVYGSGVLAPWIVVLELLQDAEADLDLRIGAEQVLATALFRIRAELTNTIPA